MNKTNKNSSVPENFFGITDSTQLDKVAGDLASQRLFELEHGKPFTTFTREDLLYIHAFLLQDIYPWAGKIRTEEVGAMGMMMCRAQFVETELERVFRDIGRRPPSTTDKEEAVAALADHWCELTLVHPFRDGNSRTQRFFFDQLLRSAGWAINWNQVSAEEVHAARYVGAATTDSSFLAQVLLPGVGRREEIMPGTLTHTQGKHDPGSSSEIFHAMMEQKRRNPGHAWVSP